MAGIFQDLRFALRMLAKNPGFTAVAVLTLALGMGANVSIFTLINGLILRPLPYPQTERVVQVDRQMKGGPYYGMSFMQFRLYQRQNRTFQHLAAYDLLGSGLSLNTGADPELIQSRRVSADFFRAIGIAPAMGRDFDAADDRPGASPVVILSYRIWQDLLGGDSTAIGKSVRLGGENFAVIGVTPPNFTFSRAADAWVPLRTAEDPSDRASAFGVIGRLRSGVPYELAKQDLDGINEHIRKNYPAVIDPDEVGTIVTSFQESMVGDIRPLLLLLAGAVACVLLIACSNTANLLLARAVNRRKEIAIRTALGVSPGRLVRQLLTESALLSTLGGVGGLLLSQWCIRFFLAFFSASIPGMPHVSMDFHVLLFTFGLSLLTGLMFGTVPIFQLRRLDSAEIFRESGRSTGSASTRRLQGFLVSCEICLATILLLGAGLLLSSFEKILRVAPGFDPRPVLTLKTSLAGPGFSPSSRVATVVRKAVDRLRSVPGVCAVAAATMLPTEPSVQLPFELPSLPVAERPTEDSEVQWRAISPAYFDVMSIRFVNGRPFSENDASGGSPVAIVNQEFVRQYFSGLDGVGQSILIGRREGAQFADNSRQIVGVVADTREMGLNEPVSPTVFIPLAQVPASLLSFTNKLMPMNWLMRVSGEPLGYSQSMRNELLAVDSELASSTPRSLSQVLSASLRQQKMQTTLLGSFSIAALLLGAIGLYGVLAYSVAERKQEFGIRMALGSEGGQILRLVIGHGLKLTLTGILIGVAIALALTRFMNSLLFGVSNIDSHTFVTVAILLTSVALVACYVPARRATKVDPIVALRYE